MDSDSDDASLEDEEAVGGRSRDLLSSFYGKMASDVAPPEEEEDEALDPIDREDFDADAHVRGLLKTEPLPKLLERDDALCREVKSLSGDMQMLVYENYSKFIGATDTIRDMKDNAGRHGGRDDVAERGHGRHRRDVGQAPEFLFELPKKLAAAIADGRHGEAVTSFQAVDGVLRKYAHVPSLADIHAESAAIVAGRVAALTAAFVGPYGAGAAQLARVAELTDARLAGVASASPRPSLDQSRADLVAKYVLRLERVLAAAEGHGPPTAEAAAALAAALAARRDARAAGRATTGPRRRRRRAGRGGGGRRRFAGARRAAADAVARLPGAVRRAAPRARAAAVAGDGDPPAGRPEIRDAPRPFGPRGVRGRGAAGAAAGADAARTAPPRARSAASSATRAPATAS
ncbi:3'5'-cyclic nucleotide phosphodiesterase [Aureococcus anophagefferens]|nr:3'5'-cyclic nucleotide phosphodiesterase [Aureococcus anophagefferens]